MDHLELHSLVHPVISVMRQETGYDYFGQIVRKDTDMKERIHYLESTVLRGYYFKRVQFKEDTLLRKYNFERIHF